MNCGVKPQKLAVLTTSSGLPANCSHRSMRSLLRSLGNSPCSMLGHSAASVGATSNKDRTALRSSMTKPSLTDRSDATPK
ncbi:hypothetical protein D9M68_853660 [compost metagenome]